MLPTLDSVSSRILAWRSASLPVKSLQGAAALVAGVFFWPFMVGIAYVMVVRSRLSSPRSSWALAGAMVLAALVAQGAWSQWMIAGVTSAQPSTAASNDDSVSPTPQFGTVAGSSTSGGTGSTLDAQVVRVITGSYIEVMIMEQLYQVQLIGLKAPDPGSSSQPPACFGQESKNYLQGLLSSGHVLLATDEQLPDRDDVGVMLRYAVGSDGSILNRQMLDAGMVEEIGTAGYTQKVSFIGAQEAAKVAKRGLWGTCYSAALPTPTPTPTPSPSVSAAISKAISPIVPSPTPAPKPKPSSSPTPTPAPTHAPTPTPPTPTPTPS